MRLPFLFFISLLFTANSISGQGKSKVLDSLLSALEQQDNIESKCLTLAEIVEYHMYNDSKKGVMYAEQMINASQEANYGIGLAMGNFLKGNCFAATQKMDSAQSYYYKTLDLAKKHDINTCVASSMANLSVIEGENGNYAKAIQLMDSVAKINLEEKDFLNYGVTLNNRAHHFYEQGDFVNAMIGFQESLDVLDTINRDVFRKADVLRNIGKLNYQENDSKDAIKYYLEAFKVYEQVNDYLYQAYIWSDIGNVHLAQKDYKNAIKNFEKSLELGKANGFKDVQYYAFNNMGIAKREGGDYQSALSLFKKAMEVVDFEISKANEVVNLYHLGYTYGLLGDKQMALEKLNASIQTAGLAKQANELKNALEMRSKVYSLFGDFNLALNDKNRMVKIKDSLFTVEKTKQIEQLQTIYETEKKEAAIALQQEEIKTLNEKAKVDKLTKSLYAGGMFTFISVSGLLFFGFRQRIKRNRLAREKQEAIYKQEISHKKKELASQTLHLVQKNTFIQALLENLENIRNSPERFKVEFRRIVMLLRKENASDKDWEVFKTYFSEVHNDFDQKLKTLYADISEKEIRLAAFLRMNLTTKEIAATLNVLPDSILKSKYRLKKKLGLDKETDLTRFLNAI